MENKEVKIQWCHIIDEDRINIYLYPMLNDLKEEKFNMVVIKSENQTLLDQCWIKIPDTFFSSYNDKEIAIENLNKRK